MIGSQALGGGGGRQACTEGGEAAWKGGEIDRFGKQERQPGQTTRPGRQTCYCTVVAEAEDERKAEHVGGRGGNNTGEADRTCQRER